MSKSRFQQRKPLKGTHIGWVESDRHDKTRRVAVIYLSRVPKYEKFVRKRTVYHVHDPDNSSKKGDMVEIAPCRPISKTKSWRLVKVVEAAPGGAPAPQDTEQVAADATDAVEEGQQA